MPTPTPIPLQEKAYAAISITSNPVNLAMAIFTYTVYYNYNPDTLVYDSWETKQITLPINSINATMQVNFDSTDTEINSSLIIKNNDIVILTLNSNDWYIDLGDRFQSSNFQTFYDSIKDIATS